MSDKVTLAQIRKLSKLLERLEVLQNELPETWARTQMNYPRHQLMEVLSKLEYQYRKRKGKP